MLNCPLCKKKLAALESLGINYVRCNFNTQEAQDRVANWILPRLDEVSAAQPVS